MGNSQGATKAGLLQHAPRLEAVIGAGSVARDDPRWKELLNLATPVATLPPQDVAEAFHPFVVSLKLNNDSSGNFQCLVEHAIANLNLVPDTLTASPLSTLNALLLFRVLLKELIETLPSVQVLNFFETSSDNADTSLLARLVDALFAFVLRKSLCAHSIPVYVEVVSTLYVLLSSQMFLPEEPAPESTHGFSCTTHVVLSRHKDARNVVLKLLHYFVKMHDADGISHADASGGGVLSVFGSVASSVFSLPSTLYSSLTHLFVRDGENKSAELVVAERSVLLLLALVHDYSVETNNFRTAFNSVQDGERQVRFSQLYDLIGEHLMEESTTVLAYSLIHGNKMFLEFALARTDIDTILLPILEMLYEAQNLKSNKRYMLLIIVLILTQDASFNSNIHMHIILPQVRWYKEKVIHNISAGGLLVLVFTRLILQSLPKLFSHSKDSDPAEAENSSYLVTNCLAILTNTAPHFYGLHSIASQKVLVVLDLFERKLFKLEGIYTKKCADESATETDGTSIEVLQEQIASMKEFVRIVLEIINSALTFTLPRNLHLVYWVLHQQQIFEPLEPYDRFRDLLANINVVLKYFDEQVLPKTSDEESSIESIQQIIERIARSWKADRLQVFPELKFTYEEEADPATFFTPYVWSLVENVTEMVWVEGGPAGGAGADEPVAPVAQTSPGLRRNSNKDHGKQVPVSPQLSATRPPPTTGALEVSMRLESPMPSISLAASPATPEPLEPKRLSIGSVEVPSPPEGGI